MAGPAGLQNTSMYFALRAAYAFKIALYMYVPVSRSTRMCESDLQAILVNPFGSTPARGTV
jgi:hypothetical protein